MNTRLACFLDVFCVYVLCIFLRGGGCCDEYSKWAKGEV